MLFEGSGNTCFYSVLFLGPALTLQNLAYATGLRTSDRAGRARAPTHAHPVFDDKISTPTHPARAKKTKWTPTRPLGECLSNTPTHPAHRKRTKFGVGARSPLKRHPVARWPVGLEAGVPTSGACRWPLHLSFVIPGDPERFFVYSCAYYRSYCPH